MKLGVHIGYWGLGLSASDQLEIVREAERLGYDSVWASEAYGSDAATVLAWLAAATTRIRLGSAIFQMPGRSPAMTAMTAATLDQLSGGRMLLGIGSSGPQVAEGWHGQRFGAQLQRTREYVAVVRMALARERVEFHGETLDLPLPDGPGRSLKLTISPVQERIPIYLAAIGPKNTALAGEIADGWIPMLLSPEHLGEARSLLEEGAARSGRSLAGFDIAPSVNLLISDDVDAARDAVRPLIALYVGGMGSAKQNFYNRLVSRYGFADAARRDPGALPRRPQGRGGRRRPRQPDRRGVPLRVSRPRARAARRLPGGRRRHARGGAAGLERRRQNRSVAPTGTACRLSGRSPRTVPPDERLVPRAGVCACCSAPSAIPATRSR